MPSANVSGRPVVYEVAAQIDEPLREAYERYMRREHIPAVLATGCFTGATFEGGPVGRRRTRYRLAGPAALER